MAHAISQAVCVIKRGALYLISMHLPEVNPNASWVNTRGSWIVNLMFPFILRVGCALIPGISREAAWTLTNLSYNTVVCINLVLIYNVSWDCWYTLFGSK